jgi:hypothetical protein
MNVLILMERSGVIRRAFRARGHNAYSLDLAPSADDSPYHIQAEALEYLARCDAEGYPWDLLIAHPDCTYLCGSGLHWNRRRPGRAEKTEAALEMVRTLLAAKVPRIALENPRGCIGTRIRPFDQTIQPYEFGDDASKQTDLWLCNLPLLIKDPAARVPGRICYRPDGRPVERWANQTDSGQNRLGPSAERAALRAQTYPGIADAMAEQWGELPPRLTLIE